MPGLINLTHLYLSDNDNISDLSPLAGLINLRRIKSWGEPISDLSPLAGLTELENVDICGADISDLTPLAGLTDLKELYLRGNRISDISSLVGLAGLTRLRLDRNEISDVSPLAGLTNLEWLHLARNEISEVAPLASLANLTWLNVSENEISDVSPLAGLINLKWLGVYVNNISDFSPLDGLRENIELLWHGNPPFPKGGPKIEGPWLWVVLPNTLDSSTDLLSEASGGTVTEVGIATHGATVGSSVGDDVWTFHRLPPTGHDNIENMLGRGLPRGTVYGSVSLHSPQEQETTMYVGGDNGVKVWLNGTLIYEAVRALAGDDYTDFFPVTLRQGRNVLLVRG